MSEEEKYNDIDQLMYREMPPDRYCYIHNYIVDLKSQLQQKENIIKEVREYIQDRYDGEALTHTFDKDNVKELLDILQGSDKE